MGRERAGFDAESMMRDLHRRVMHTERRSQIHTAADLMGPGLAPMGVQLFDWNQDEATFNGLWYSTPGAANTPDVDGYWAGYSIGNVDGYGIQVVTRYTEGDAESPPDWVPDRFVRRFYTPIAGVRRSYSVWVSLSETGPAGPPGPPGPPGSPGYRHTQASASASWSVAHSLNKKPSVTILVDGLGRVETDIADIDDDNLTIVFPTAVTGVADLV